jgi:hypothetical protein
MLQMHDDWQVAGSQLNSKTPPQGAQTASQAILLPWQQARPVCPALAESKTAGVTGVIGAAPRKLRPGSHPAVSADEAAAGVETTAAAASSKAKRLTRIVFLMVHSLWVETSPQFAPAAHQRGSFAVAKCMHAQFQMSSGGPLIGPECEGVRTGRPTEDSG